ncbi:MAG TPA: pyridoxal 5'-phosphate synthase glutaminase subunit PdxT [Chloroflexota bacterium]|nr:pyridoxal 5'-phosphate synthase glutaminase subunit PdxT [Chloroflexota bacterium]
MKIGILALQGAFAEHEAVLRALGADVVQVRLPQQLGGLQGLIIPGGESTTMAKLMAAYQLEQPIRQLAEQGVPLWGTCAGMIAMARDIDGSLQPRLGLMDIAVSRNAFGRQVDSFEQDLAIAVLGHQPFHAVFIRAPLLTRVGPAVRVLARLQDGRMVAAQERNLLVTAFHPELTADNRFHALFLNLAGSANGLSSGAATNLA